MKPAAILIITGLAACTRSEVPTPEMELTVELATAVLDVVLDSTSDGSDPIFWADPRLAESIWALPNEFGGLSGALGGSASVESPTLREAIDAHPRVSTCPHFGETRCLLHSPLDPPPDDRWYWTINLGAPVALPDGRALMGTGVMIAAPDGGPWDFEMGFIVFDRSDSGRWGIDFYQGGGWAEMGGTRSYEEAPMAAIQAALRLGESEDVTPSQIGIVVETTRLHKAVLRLNMTPIGDRLDALSCPSNRMKQACTLDGFERLIEVKQSAVFSDRALLEIELVRPNSDGSGGTEALSLYMTLGVSDDGWVVEDYTSYGWN